MTYNGWKNYETWAVGLWIDNEEPTSEHKNELVLQSRANPAQAWWLAGQIKDWVQGWTASDLLPNKEASLTSDLLGAALSEVDWDELAKAWIEDADADTGAQ